MSKGFTFMVFIASTAVSAQPLPLNPEVNQSTIEFTTCRHGWTRTIRPPVTLTNEIKHTLMRQYGFQPTSERSLILDHRIPLVLGGAPEDINNLILQPKNESRDKDRIEVCLARTVCNGRITLLEAQKAIWSNWKTAGKLCRGYDLLKLKY